MRRRNPSAFEPTADDERRAREHALKRLGAHDPALAARAAGKDPAAERAAADRLAVFRDEALERHLGAWPTDDNAYGSIDAPPALAFAAPLAYRFRGQVPAGRYVVELNFADWARRPSGVVEARILQPRGAKSDFGNGYNAVGGELRRHAATGLVSAQLTHLTPFRGSLDRAADLMALWCRLLRGYGINGWRASRGDWLVLRQLHDRGDLVLNNPDVAAYRRRDDGAYVRVYGEPYGWCAARVPPPRKARRR